MATEQDPHGQLYLSWGVKGEIIQVNTVLWNTNLGRVNLIWHLHLTALSIQSFAVTYHITNFKRAS